MVLYLGLILWDFSKLQMKFHIDNRTLQGLTVLIINLLATTNLRLLLDFLKTLVVERDAYASGIEGTLRKKKPIANFSQALQGKNHLFSTYEKEIFALVLVLQK